MKKFLAAVSLSLFGTVAAASCVTNTYFHNGKMTVCTTCCFNGSCTTTCN